MKAIIDIVLLGILIAYTWSGYKKGLIMGVGGIVCILISIFGANLLANTFAYDVTPAIKPFASGFMETQINQEDGVRERMGWEAYDLSVSDLLEKYPDRRLDFCVTCYETLGIDESTAKSMADNAIEYAELNGTDIMTAVNQILCEKVSYVGCFIIAFVLIIIVLTVIGNLPNLSYKLPNLDTLNDIGGAALGLVKGVMFCIIIVWVLKFMGMLIGRETLSDTVLAKLFVSKNLLSKFLGL